MGSCCNRDGGAEEEGITHRHVKNLLLKILPTKTTNPEIAEKGDEEEEKNDKHFVSLFSLGVDLDGDGDEDDVFDLIVAITTTKLLEGITYKILKDIATELFNLPEPPKFDEETDPLKKKIIQEFNNTRLKELMVDATFESPSTRMQLLDVVEDAVREGVHIKAMGTGYGFTNVTYTDGLLIDMFDHMETVDIGYDAGLLNDYGMEFHKGGHYLCCESGCNFDQIQLYLWPYEKRRQLYDDDGKRYQFMPDSTGYTSLCLGGVVSVGGMGSGTPYNYGGICRTVASFCMLIINENREAVFVQIEPSVGNGAIHDKSKWDAAQASIENVKERIELIQDDDVYDAALVSVGLFGIIYSFMLKLEDVYFVRETRVLMTFDRFADKYENEYLLGTKEGSIDRIVAWFSPYKLRAGPYSKSTPVVVTLLKRTTEVPHHTANVFTAGSMRGDDSSIVAAAAVLTWLSKVSPFLVPFALYMGLKTAVHKGLVMDCITGLQFGEANAVPTYAIGVSTKVEYAVESCAGFINLCNELRDNDRRQLITGTFSMRFAPAQRGYLQMAENQSTVWFEAVIPNFENTEWKAGSVQKWEDTFRAMQHFFLSEKYQGKIHLGLWMDVSPDIWRYYASIGKFVEHYKKFNHFGYFCNAFSVQSGLDEMAGLPKRVRGIDDDENKDSEP